jgi:hypothetical protein
MRSWTLPAEVIEGRRLLAEVEAHPTDDTALIKARKGAEWLCRVIIERETTESCQGAALDALIARVTKLKKNGDPLLPALIATELRVIQLYGNLASHAQDERTVITSTQATAAINSFAVLEDWFEEVYLGVRPATPKLENLKLGKATSTTRNLREIRRLRRQLDGKNPDASILIAGKLARRIAEHRLAAHHFEPRAGATLSELVDQLALADRGYPGTCPAPIQERLRYLDVCEQQTRSGAAVDQHDQEIVDRCVATAQSLAEWVEQNRPVSWWWLWVALALAAGLFILSRLG